MKPTTKLKSLIKTIVEEAIAHQNPGFSYDTLKTDFDLFEKEFIKSYPAWVGVLKTGQAATIEQLIPHILKLPAFLKLKDIYPNSAQHMAESYASIAMQGLRNWYNKNNL